MRTFAAATRTATVCATATKTAALTLARRAQALAGEIDELDVLIAGLVKQTAPGLLNVYGVGVDVAAAILVAVGDNPERIRNEAAFAKLCGVAPLPADTGKRTGRHRFNQGGNRHANSALWHIVLTRVVATRTAHRRLRRTTSRGRPVDARDLPLPQALRRPRGLHRAAAVTLIVVTGLTRECPDRSGVSRTTSRPVTTHHSGRMT